MSAVTWMGLLLAIAFSLMYQVYITRRVIKYPHCTNRQKALQLALVWLLPLIGAAVVHGFFKQDASSPPRRDTAFTPDDLGHGGGADVGGH
jgi:hypothetical protein